MRLYRIPKDHLPAGLGRDAAPRAVVPAVTAAGLELRDAGPGDYPAADPDPATGRPRVRAQYLLDVEPDPTDPAFVVCRVAEVLVPADGATGETSPVTVIWVE